MTNAVTVNQQPFLFLSLLVIVSAVAILRVADFNRKVLDAWTDDEVMGSMMVPPLVVLPHDVAALKVHEDKVPTVATSDRHTMYVWMHIPKTGGTSAYRALLKNPIEKGLVQGQPREKPSDGAPPPPKSPYNSNVSIYPNVQSPGLSGIQDWNVPGCDKTGNPLDKRDYSGTHCARSEILHCLQDRIYRNATHKIDYRFLTVLRDPVDRVISEYWWWRDHSEVLAWTDSMKETAQQDFSTWIKDPTNVGHNRQARHFLMTDPKPHLSECRSWNGTAALEWTNERYGSIEAFNNLEVSIDDLLDAKNFFFVAVLEEPDLNEKAYQAVFGRTPWNLKRSNRKKAAIHSSAKLEETTDEQRQMILERNRLDYLLYNKALENLKTLARQTSTG